MPTWALPQPFESVDHTADTGVRVTGTSAEETLARLVLAHAQLLSGGEPVEVERSEPIEVAGDEDLSLVGVDLLRELNRLFCVDRRIAAAVEVEQVGTDRVRLRVDFGTYDPERHTEGIDIKAVTFHAAEFRREGDGWVAQVLFDI
jgi:SHS2 domain-containing protein